MSGGRKEGRSFNPIPSPPRTETHDRSNQETLRQKQCLEKQGQKEGATYSIRGADIQIEVVPLQSLHRYLHTGQGLQKGSSATMARRRRRRQSRFVSLVCTDRQTDARAPSSLSSRSSCFSFPLHRHNPASGPHYSRRLFGCATLPPRQQSPVVTDFTTQVADLFTPRIEIPCSHLCYNFTQDTFKTKNSDHQIRQSHWPGEKKFNLKNLQAYTQPSFC